MSLLFRRLSALFVCTLLLVLLPAPPVGATRPVRAGLEQNPPLSFIDEQGRPSGLLVDLLEHIAAAEGWRVSYVPDTFDRCLEKLGNGEIDLMVTIAYSKERAERFDFNRLDVVANWGVLYTAPGKSFDSYFALEGKTLAVMRQDTHHRALRSMLEKFGIRARYLELDNFDQVFTATQDGTADAGVVGRFYALRREAAFRVQPTPIIFNPIEVHYATRKGANTELLAEIDRQLERLKGNSDSYYYECLERWLGVVHKDKLPAWLVPTIYGGAALLAVLFLFILVLRQQVKSRTRHLEEEVGERLRAERALQVSERSYRELVESVSAVILRWSPDGLVTFINEYGEDLFGYARGELIGRHVVGSIVPADRIDGRNLEDMIRDICARPEDFSVNENQNVKKDGTLLWIAWRNRPVRDEQGNLIGILSVGIDVTARHKAEESQRQLDRAKDSFISTAAHELRTPLTTIIGYAELLRNDLPEDRFSAAEKQEFLNYIYERGLLLARIVSDLLDVTRIQQGVPLPLHCAPGSLPTLTRRVIDQYHTLKPGSAIHLVAPTPLPELVFDAERIGQVLENLLSNAVKYSPQGSPITVTLQSEPSVIRVSVTDQGIGMTAEQVARVFDKFYRADLSDTAAGGLGLGMSIARQIVESHGGSIWVESLPGVGTTVSFTLPQAPPPAI